MMISRIIPWGFPIKSGIKLQKPVFVFGSGRNGSTLLNRMLNKHPQLFCPTEQYFLGPNIIKFYLYRHFLNWRDLVKVLAGELDPSSGSHTWETGFNPQLSDLFESENKNLQFLIDTFYRTYGKSQKKGFNTWVDTSSPNTRYFKEIYQCFPDAKYCFLIRDGRDVINSYTKGGKQHFGEIATPSIAAQHWIDSVNAYHWLEKKTQVLVIKYEELVQNPEFTLKTICEYLGTEFTEEMLDFYQEKLPSGLSDEYFKNVRKPVFKSSVRNWEHQLDSAILEEVTPKIEPYLKFFNYK